MSENQEPTTTEEQVFRFLDDLRESGVTNMYGAGPYVQDEFGMDEIEAGRFLVSWMETFAQRHPDS